MPRETGEAHAWGGSWSGDGLHPASHCPRVGAFIAPTCRTTWRHPCVRLRHEVGFDATRCVRRPTHLARVTRHRAHRQATTCDPPHATRGEHAGPRRGRTRYPNGGGAEVHGLREHRDMRLQLPQQDAHTHTQLATRGVSTHAEPPYLYTGGAVYTGRARGAVKGWLYRRSWRAGVGCRTRLRHMTVNTLAPRYRQLCTALTLPSALQFNQNPQLVAASTPLSCEVYIVLRHTYDIEQSRLRCVTLPGSTRGCWSAPIDDGSRVSHERRGGVLYGPAGVS
jgi:hypothetical protein